MVKVKTENIKANKFAAEVIRNELTRFQEETGFDYKTHSRNWVLDVYEIYIFGKRKEKKTSFMDKIFGLGFVDTYGKLELWNVLFPKITVFAEEHFEAFLSFAKMLEIRMNERIVGIDITIEVEQSF